MIALKQAIITLDGVIPAPDNKMVNAYHMPIAVAWQECKKALATYDDMQDRHDTLMRRWEGMVEAIRRRIDAGTLSDDDKRLLDELNLPHRYDKRGARFESEPIGKDEIMEYAQRCGTESAANLLLLLGPDGFNGSYDAYQELEKALNGKGRDGA